MELFPVQAAAWVHTAGGHSTAHDLCIAAPTGSGKTLAYVLPIVQGLAGCALCLSTPCYQQVYRPWHLPCCHIRVSYWGSEG